jgi:hypothetical protein
MKIQLVADDGTIVDEIEVKKERKARELWDLITRPRGIQIGDNNIQSNRW